MNSNPNPQATEDSSSGESSLSLRTAFLSPSGTYVMVNRRSGLPPRIYPWLLIISTTIAALFCLLYITKPVFPAFSAPLRVTVPAPSAAVTAKSSSTPTPMHGMPNANCLPGDLQATPATTHAIDSEAPRSLPEPPSISAFEETNLKIQHVLTAEVPGGHLARIDVEVPALYQSRHLRWTPDNVAEARKLLVLLMGYQEKSQRLRAEEIDLLNAWNALIGRSLPATDLRADSPSLPANQEDTANETRPAGLITTESIQIQPAGK